MEEKTGIEPTTDMIDIEINEPAVPSLDYEVYQFLDMLQDPKFQLLFMALMVWTAVWKGMALWRAARNSQLPWFIALLIVNTMGVLEIIYIAFFQKKPKKVKTIAQRKAPAKKKAAPKKKTTKRKIAKK